jgi:hypothetical protein
MVFVRRSGALGLGNVGRGYQYSDGGHDEGAVENQSGMAVDPPSQNGFWNSQVTDPLADMRKLSYGRTFEMGKPKILSRQNVLWILIRSGFPTLAERLCGNLRPCSR